jgi:hypothetical protein
VISKDGMRTNTKSVVRILPRIRFNSRTWSCLLAIVLAGMSSMPVLSGNAVTIPEEIEWTWEVRPPQPDPALPNVLLLGDSISRNYFPEVRENLEGVANVYLMASSTSVGDPRLPHEIAEFAAVEKVRFRVVHFNNGMHGWAYTEAQYKAAFPAFLRAVHLVTQKDGALIWASTTPVRSDANNGATNPRVEDRNRIAQQFVQAARIPIDDQFSLMQKHQDLYQDPIHFNAAGATIQGDQVTATIRAALVTQK